MNAISADFASFPVFGNLNASLQTDPFWVNNQPIALREGETVEITSDLLAVSDPDNLPSELTYQLKLAPYQGTLRRRGVALARQDTFTQQDINLGWLTYTHDGTKTKQDSFQITVGDPDSQPLVQITQAFDGSDSNGDSTHPRLSGDENWLVFASEASNLVVDDTNNTADVFRYNLQTQQLQRLQLTAIGTQTNGATTNPDISANGRFIVVQSAATNLISADTNQQTDIFLYDTQTGQLVRISTTNQGNESNGASVSPVISADGRYVAFVSQATNLVAGDTNGLADIFVKDAQTGQISRVSLASDGTEGNGASASPAISADGRYVAFASQSSNLVPGDTNGVTDVFVYDTQTRQTQRVSVGSNGTQADSASEAPDISTDGRFVVFGSYDANLEASGSNNALPSVYRHNIQTHQTTQIATSNLPVIVGESSTISADGRYVAFDVSFIYGTAIASERAVLMDMLVGDTSDLPFIDRSYTILPLIDRNYYEQLDLSSNGRFLSFQARAVNNPFYPDASPFWDIFLYDAAAKSPLSGTTQLNITLVNDQNQWNDDPYSDILWYNPISGRVSLWFMENRQLQNTSLVTPQWLMPNTEWRPVGVGDFDRDGEDDVLWHQPLTGALSIWLMDGNQVYRTQAIDIPTGGAWIPQTVGDFDGDDQRDDIWWRNQIEGSHAIWIMDGNQYQRTIVPDVPPVGTPGGWQLEGVGNFDDDPTANDLIWRQYDLSYPQGGRTSLWLMTGSRLDHMTEISADAASPGWMLQGAADFDGDLKADDLLWLNSINHRTAIWNLEGTTLQSQGLTAVHGGDNWFPIV